MKKHSINESQIKVFKFAVIFGALWYFMLGLYEFITYSSIYEATGKFFSLRHELDFLIFSPSFIIPVIGFIVLSQFKYGDSTKQAQIKIRVGYAIAAIYFLLGLWLNSPLFSTSFSMVDGFLFTHWFIFPVFLVLITRFYSLGFKER